MAMFRINKNLCAFSPCGTYFASALQQELIVRNSNTLETSHSFIFVDKVELIEWSPDGQYIFCASFKKATVQIFSLQCQEWKCKLIEGSAGLQKIIWAPDTKSLLIISDLNIHISIWTPTDENITHIWNLKSSVLNIALNEIGRKVAVIVTTEGTDSVEIYKIGNWRLCRKLACDKLFGIDGICWSNNGELLAIWCAIIGKSRLLIYSAATNAHIGAFSGDDNINIQNFTKILNQYCSAKAMIGIEKVVWSPNGQLLAIAGSNETVAIVNHATWSIIFHLYCSPVIKGENYLSRVFKEVKINAKRDWSNYPASRSIPEHNHRYPLDEINERPINITIDVTQNNYEICVATIDIVEFSRCGKFIAVKHQLYPSTLWIWHLTDDSVDYVLLKKPISGVTWDPTKARLLVFSKSQFIIEWRHGKHATCFESPRGMHVLNAKWHPNGEIVALYGYNKTSVICLKE